MSDTKLIRVAIHGVPRSGTSWIGEIVNSSPHTAYRFQPLFSYALKDFLTPGSTRKDIDAFFELLLHTEDDFINQTVKRESGDFPVFSKTEATHIVYKEVRYVNLLFNLMRKSDSIYLCAVIRNPLSTISSWLKAPREFRQDLGWSAQEEWRYALKKNLNKPEEFNGYEKWREATNIFLHLKTIYPSRVYIAKYSNFLSNPNEEAQNLFDAIGLEMTEQTQEFLRQSSNNDNADPYAVFRANQRDDKWKTKLDPIIAQQIINDVQGTALQEYVEPCA